MKKITKYYYILTPFLIPLAVFVFLGILFLNIDAYIDYQKYLHEYNEKQKTELATIQTTTNKVVKDLISLLNLAMKRIEAAGEDANRIQIILNSFDYFSSNLKIPVVQRFTYFQLTDNPLTINRFGITPLNAELSPTENHIKKDIFIHFNGDTVYGKSCIVGENNSLIGILQIELSLSDFRNFMGRLTTLTFVPSLGVTYELIQEEPFAVFKIPHHSYLQFARNNKANYLVFLIYIATSISLIIFFFNHLSSRLRQKYLTTITTLKGEVTQKDSRVNEFIKITETQIQEKRNEELSYQTSKVIYKGIRQRQQEHALYVTRSLEVVKKSLEDTSIFLTDQERSELLGNAYLLAYKLSRNSVKATKLEQIDLSETLNDIQAFFAEKLFKSGIVLNMISPPSITYKGDRLITKLMLVNIIGKSIYRVPKNGKISVIVKDDDSSIHLEIRDNGYSLADTAQKLMKKTFDHCIDDDVFYELCQENHITYEPMKAESGENITKIILNKSNAEISYNNVVSLFKENR